MCRLHSRALNAHGRGSEGLTHVLLMAATFWTMGHIDFYTTTLTLVSLLKGVMWSAEKKLHIRFNKSDPLHLLPTTAGETSIVHSRGRTCKVGSSTSSMSHNMPYNPPPLSSLWRPVSGWNYVATAVCKSTQPYSLRCGLLSDGLDQTFPRSPRIPLFLVSTPA